MLFTVLGSCSLVKLPNELGLFHNNKYLIDPRNGTPMEMNSISLYNIFDYLECNEGKDIIIQLMINRINSNYSFTHNAWGMNETHCRFVSAMIRLFDYPYVEEALNKNGVYTQDVVDKHIKISEILDDGLWFLHDSIEYNSQSYPHTFIENTKLGSSSRNMLILNTHIDTLVSLLVIEKKFYNLSNKIDSGLNTLFSFIDKCPLPPPVFCSIDRVIRNIYIRFLINNENYFYRFFSNVVKFVYYRFIRIKIKNKVNLLAFDDGFLERDLCLSGDGLVYHLVNTWDFCKLAYILSSDNVRNKIYDIEALIELAYNGVVYACSEPYLSYIDNLSKKNGISNELLEAIILLYSLGRIDKAFLITYFYFRASTAPAAGVLGSDIVISGNDGLKCKARFLSEFSVFKDCDVIPLRNSDIFIANKTNSVIFINVLQHGYSIVSNTSSSVDYLEANNFLLIRNVGAKFS